jgi:hypothetical protein
MSVGDVFGLVAVILGFITAVGIVASVVKRAIALQERKLEILAGKTAEKAAQYATHNGELEERLRVVERIVSDKGYDIALQIDALRDIRMVDAEKGTVS